MRSGTCMLTDLAHATFVAADMELLMDMLYVRVHRMVANLEGGGDRLESVSAPVPERLASSKFF